MGKDFYKILGVGRNATDQEIKSAYRKSALKFHPDRLKNKTPAEQKAGEEKFKEVNYAYEILSDTEKKKRYDQFGEAGINPSAAGPSSGGFSPHGNHSFHFSSSGSDFDPFSTFSSFFGPDFKFEQSSSSNDPFGMGGFNFGNMGGQSMHMGGHRNMHNMNMMGGQSQKREQKITGVTDTIEHPISLSLFELSQGCKKKFKISRYRNVNGSYQKTPKIFEIDVKPGYKAGTKIRYPQDADEQPGKLAGDIVFVINEKPNTHFKRDGDNLTYTIPITLSKAIGGERMSFYVPKLENENDFHSLIVSNECLGPQTIKRIRAMGMPNSKSGIRGDILVKFDVVFPEMWTEGLTEAAEIIGRLE